MVDEADTEHLVLIQPQQVVMAVQVVVDVDITTILQAAEQLLLVKVMMVVLRNTVEQAILPVPVAVVQERQVQMLLKLLLVLMVVMD